MAYAERSVVYPSWPRLAILDLLSTRRGHDGDTTAGRPRRVRQAHRRQAQAGKGAARTVGFLPEKVTVVVEAWRGDRVDGRDDQLSTAVPEAQPRSSDLPGIGVGAKPQIARRAQMQ